MNRVVTRIGLMLLYGLAIGGAVSACVSEDSTFRPLPSTGGATGSAGTAAGTGATAGKPPCNPMYCPSHPPAMVCCTAANDCGLDWGTGCMAAAKKDGGQ